MAEPSANSGTRGRPYNRAIATAQKWATKLHVAAFRATGGRIGGRMLNSPVLLLTTTGRKTGKERVTPLLYLRNGNNFAIVASNGGAPKHPVWWLNLQNNPEAEVEIQDTRLRVRAEVTTGEEKRHLWDRLVRRYPPYRDYQRRTDREIPVILLEPVP